MLPKAGSRSLGLRYALIYHRCGPDDVVSFSVRCCEHSKDLHAFFSTGVHIYPLKNLELACRLRGDLSTGVVAVSGGEKQTCALLNDGDVLCWGDNDLGEVGTGDETNRFTPTAVVGLSTGAFLP